MQEEHLQPRDPQPRRFIYRSPESDTQLTHPMRRRTDISHAFHASAGHNSPRPLLLKMCVLLKLN